MKKAYGIGAKKKRQNEENNNQRISENRA